TVSGRVQGVGFREFTRARARDLGLQGWVRNEEDGTIRLHAEGEAEALEALTALLAVGPPGARVAFVGPQPVPDEGHEQFAIRGVPAGSAPVWDRRRRHP
ncbi:MAG TPA: acylphosphatase, partial [Solirubrobacteraceae bacterium]|nr:acylphosphatase [Solirubrobacteraceae bacterium]